MILESLGNHMKHKDLIKNKLLQKVFWGMTGLIAVFAYAKYKRNKMRRKTKAKNEAKKIKSSRRIKQSLTQGKNGRNSGKRFSEIWDEDVFYNEEIISSISESEDINSDDEIILSSFSDKEEFGGTHFYKMSKKYLQKEEENLKEKGMDSNSDEEEKGEVHSLECFNRKRSEIKTLEAQQEEEKLKKMKLDKGQRKHIEKCLSMYNNKRGREQQGIKAERGDKKFHCSFGEKERKRDVKGELSLCTGKVYEKGSLLNEVLSLKNSTGSTRGDSVERSVDHDYGHMHSQHPLQTNKPQYLEKETDQIFFDLFHIYAQSTYHKINQSKHTHNK